MWCKTDPRHDFGKNMKSEEDPSDIQYKYPICACLVDKKLNFLSFQRQFESVKDAFGI